MKSMMLNALKGVGFTSTCFVYNLIGFNEVNKPHVPLFTLFCAAIGVVVFSILAGLGTEAIIDQLKKTRDKWNGNGLKRGSSR